VLQYQRIPVSTGPRLMSRGFPRRDDLTGCRELLPESRRLQSLPDVRCLSRQSPQHLVTRHKDAS